MRALFPLLLAVMVSGVSTASPQSSELSPYPNELQGYEFFRTARRRSLQPLISTMDDVRRTLGNPDEAKDLSQYAAPYPWRFCG